MENNNFENENNELNSNINAGFEAPSADDPLNLNMEEPYVQTPIPSVASDNLASVKPRKSRKWIIPTLAGVGVAVAACVCSVLFIPSVNNFFKLHTQKPIAYYQDVEKENIKDTIEEEGEQIKEFTSALAEATKNLSASTNLTNLEAIPVENNGGYSNIKIALNDEFKKIVKSLITETDSTATMANATMANAILDSFKNVSVESVAMVNDKSQVSMTLNITLNDSQIISANVIVDIANYTVYVAVPQVTDTVFSVTVPKELIEELESELAADEDEINAILDKIDETVQYIEDNNDELLEFVEKYALIIVDNLEDAELSKKTEVDVNEVVVEYTEVVVNVDSDTVNKIAEAVLSELKDDDFAIELAKQFDVSKEQYKTTIDELLDEMNEAADSENTSDATLDIYTYINSKGEIVGRGISVENTKVTFVTYEKDDETQCQFDMVVEGEDNPGHLTLKSKCSGEGKKSGYIVFEFENDEYDFNVKCEAEDFEIVNETLGYCNGKITITTSFPQLEPFAIVIDAKATKKDQTVALDVLYNDSKTITVEFSAGEKAYEEIKLPGNSFEITQNTDPQSLLPELKKLNLVNIKDNVKKAVNSDAINSVIDDVFASAGLDIADGDMTDEEVNQLMSALSNDDYEDEDEVVFDTDTDIDMDYDISYDDENDYDIDMDYDISYDDENI